MTLKSTRKILELWQLKIMKMSTFKKVLFSHVAKLWKHTFSKVVNFDGFQGPYEVLLIS